MGTMLVHHINARGARLFAAGCFLAGLALGYWIWG